MILPPLPPQAFYGGEEGIKFHHQYNWSNYF